MNCVSGQQEEVYGLPVRLIALSAGFTVKAQKSLRCAGYSVAGIKNPARINEVQVDYRVSYQ
jgi:hypothetical protein